jgi:hypothetical protein
MNFFRLLFNRNKKQSGFLRHHQKPVQSTLFDEALLQSKVNEISSSKYYERGLPLKDLVQGKTVLSTKSGTSGFMLFFADKTWIVSYLCEDQLTWQVREDNLPDELYSLMNSSEYGDGYKPLLIDKPYAKVICDISAEIAHAEGSTITTVSFGANCFNFCFPGGMELDTSIVPTAGGKKALRVFWEQW